MKIITNSLSDFDDFLGKHFIELDKEELDFLTFIFTQLAKLNNDQISRSEFDYYLQHPLSIKLIPVFYACFYHNDQVITGAGGGFFGRKACAGKFVILLPKEYLWVYDAFMKTDIFLYYGEMIRWMKTIYPETFNEPSYMYEELRKYHLRRDMTLTLSHQFSFADGAPILYNMKPWPVAPKIGGINTPCIYWI